MVPLYDSWMLEATPWCGCHLKAVELGIDIGILGTIKAWAVVTLGGPGSLVGCLVGGLILGWSEAMASSYLFNAARDAVGYIVIIVALMIRPYGLFGKKKEEKV